MSDINFFTNKREWNFTKEKIWLIWRSYKKAEGVNRELIRSTGGEKCLKIRNYRQKLVVVSG